MKFFSKVVLVSALLLSLAAPALADEFLVMSGLYPPFTFNKGLHLDGVSIDTIEAIMKMTDTPFNRKNVKLMPWKKAYSETMKGKKRILLNVPRTMEVEEKFKWVGPVYFPRYVLIGKKGEEFVVSDPDDAENYSVGAIRGSDPCKALTAEGMDPKKLKASTSYVQPLLQLKSGQVDLIAHSDLATTYLMQKMRMNTQDYKVVHQYKRIPLYFAFSKDVDDAYIKKLNNALASYKIRMADGDSAFDKKLRKHLPKGPIE